MNYPEDNLRFWEQAHRETTVAIYPGGNDLAGHLAQLHVELPEFGPVLCIGVGTGEWVRELKAIGLSPWSLDVSPTAVEKLADAGPGTTDPQTLPKNTFTLALSLWVAPHMSDCDLAEQLRRVVPSLTADGVLAIHYNEPLLPDQAIDNYVGSMVEAKFAQAGKVLRTRETFSEMVQEAGGRAEFVDDRAEYPNLSMRAVMAHVRRLP